MLPRTFAPLLAIAAFAPAQNPTGRLEGRIVDLLGEPIPAAEVFVTERRMPAAMTRTDGSGTFHLPNVPLGELELHARAQGRAHGSRPVTLRADAPLLAVELALLEADALQGRVTSTDGRPIAGATVIARSTAARWLPVATETMTTDAAGRYAITAAIGEQEVLVLAPGYRVGADTRFIENATQLDFALTPGPAATLRIHVRGATEALLATAECRVAMNAGDRQLDLPPALCQGRPDARGDFVLDGLPADVTFRDYRVRMPGADVQLVRAGLVRDDCFLAEFQKAPGPAHVLKGRLLDDHGTFAVPSPCCRGETIELWPADPTLALPVRTHNSRVLDAPFVFRAPFDPAREYVVRTTPAVAIQGRVVNADGRPVRGAKVTLHGPSALADTSTDTDGRYRFMHVDAELACDLLVRAQGITGRAASELFTLAAHGDMEVPALRLRDDGGTVTGVLMDAAGNVLAGALVRLGEPRKARQVLPAPGALQAPAVSFSAHALTDRQGRFAFRHVPAGEHSLCWSRTASSPSVTNLTSVEVREAQVQHVDVRAR